MRLARLLCVLALLVFTATVVRAQTTGKISGRVTEASTGESLPGVNVSIDGTTQGTVSDTDGYYFIVNVRPGTYTLRASFVGFSAGVVEGVRVNAGLTAEIDFALREEAVGLEEIVVTSERPIVQLDVSANVASLSAEEFVNLPVAGVDQMIDLQAGIEPGLAVRGAGSDQLAFIVDGLNLRTGRDQNPFTNISYTALEEVQVQTGGFNAEYGNVRSGVINVTTKEPPRDRYTFDGLFRFVPKQDRAFDALGVLPDNCDYSDPLNLEPNCGSYWVRPLLDPEVAFDGTTAWDIYTQRQYQATSGLNVAAETLVGAGFDVAPADLFAYNRWTHRKDNQIQVPDYQADFTVGGPLIPGLSQQLGDLRFLFSYRGTQAAYTLPQTRDSYDANTFQGKITSNIRQGMKLTLHGMYGTERGQLPNGDCLRVSLWEGNIPNYPWQGLGGGACGFGNQFVTGISAERGDAVYSDALSGIGDIDHVMVGATFTHTLNAKTFYEVSLQNLSTKYRAHFANLRDGAFLCPSSGVGPDGSACAPGSIVARPFASGHLAESGNPTGLGTPFCFGGNSDINGDGAVVPYCVGEAPFGYSGQGGNLITSGESTGGHWNKTRDTTDVSVFSGRLDLTSQVNRFLQVKTGVELIVSDYNVFSQRLSQELGFFYGEFAWDRAPIQGAAYAQSKLEFQGMIANLGVRLDYFDANSEWWEYGPYDQALRSDDLDETDLPKQTPDAQVFLSPRLGISFPITENSKLYFNYGHFRQMLNPFQIFGVQASPAGGIDVIGNPDHPMPQTVAYELGFDQNLFDQFLLRVSGFYRDVRQQGRTVTYNSLGAVVSYQTLQPWNYADVRGAEFTLSKTRGRWFRGFINYTYLQTKSGNFGYAQFNENSFDQLTYLRTSMDYRLNAPIAEPFARMSLSLLTPSDYGPEMSGMHPLGAWNLTLLGEWRSGAKWTWGGGGGSFPELQNNVAWRDFLNFDLRFSKQINTSFASMQIFFDIDNFLNRKHLYNNAAFAGANRDFDYYMWSLHLPDDTFDGINQISCAQEGVDVEDCDYSDKRNLPYIWIPGDDTPGDFRKDDVAFQPIETINSLGSVTDPNEIAWYWAQDTGTYSRWNGSAWEAVPDGELKQALDDKAYIDMPNFRFNTFLNPRRFTVGLRISF